MTAVKDWDGIIKEYARSVDEEPAPAPKVDEATVLLIKERTELARRLGLPGDINNVKKMHTVERAKMYYPEWSGRRLSAWQAYLPTHYRRFHEWSTYSFDQIPLRALNAIAAADELNVFDRMEIWTPENPKKVRLRDLIDPVAIGVIDSGESSRVGYFPIVRWGAEELVSEWHVLRVGYWRHFKTLL